MVASTVAKLATIIDGEEDNRWRITPETLLLACVKVMARRFVSIRASGFARSSACSALSIHNGFDYRHSVPRHGPMGRPRQIWMKFQKHLAITARPAGLSVGGTLAQGIGAASRGERCISGLLILGPPETQNGQKKRLMPDPGSAGGQRDASLFPGGTAGSISNENLPLIER